MNIRSETKTLHSLVSIVIPTRNASRTLEICLCAIKSQTYSNIEIIIPDSNSTDSTVEIAKRYNATVIKMSSSMERTAKKNKASKLAKGSFIYFVDSDFELPPTTIEDCIKACNKGGDAVIVPERAINGNDYWSRSRQLDIIACDGDPFIESPRFFRKNVFDDIGGFDENLIFGEENDLTIRVRERGYKIVRITTPLLHHEGSINSVILRKYYYGKTFFKYVRKQRSMALIQFNPVRFGWIKNIDRLKKQPILLMGMFIQRFIATLMVILGILVGLVENHSIKRTKP